MIPRFLALVASVAIALAISVNAEEAGIKMPDACNDYLALGRFRNALLVDAARKPGGEPLTAFIEACGLQGYNVPSEVPAAP